MSDRPRSELPRRLAMGQASASRARERRRSSDDPVAAGLDRYVGLEHLDSESLPIATVGPTDRRGDEASLGVPAGAGHLRQAARLSAQGRGRRLRRHLLGSDILVFEPTADVAAARVPAVPHAEPTASSTTRSRSRSAHSRQRSTWKDLAELRVRAAADAPSSSDIAELLWAAERRSTGVRRRPMLSIAIWQPVRAAELDACAWQSR